MATQQSRARYPARITFQMSSELKLRSGTTWAMERSAASLHGRAGGEARDEGDVQAGRKAIGRVLRSAASACIRPVAVDQEIDGIENAEGRTGGWPRS